MPTPGLDGYAPSWRRPEHDDLAALARTFFSKEVVPHTEMTEPGVRTPRGRARELAAHYGDRFAPA